jgi:dehydrogenase/reductase SDR family protein 12
MAHSFNRLHSRTSVPASFDFISDFRHAPRWDPNTQSVTKLTPGPIAHGTRFLLRAALLGVRFEMPYEIAEYERPKRLVFIGSTTWLRYREEISFTADGAGTRIDYSAYMWLRSLLALGNPLLSLIYQRIGNSATRGIAAALDAAAISKAAARAAN